MVVDDDLGGAARDSGFGEVFAQLFHAGLGWGSIDVEVVLGGTADSTSRQEGRYGNAEPDGQGSPRVASRSQTKSIEQAGHDRFLLDVGARGRLAGVQDW
jgi:hypothetical protein